MKKLMIKGLTTMFVLLSLVGCSKEKSLDKQVLGCWELKDMQGEIFCFNKDKSVDTNFDKEREFYWEIEGKTLVINVINNNYPVCFDRFKIVDITKNKMTTIVNSSEYIFTKVK